MIHGLLNLSRAGKVIGEFGMVDLDELTAVIKADLGELFRSKNAELRIKVPLPQVWGDRDRIGQLIANLISNARKVQPEPESVGRGRSNDRNRRRLAGSCSRRSNSILTLSLRSKTTESASSPSFTKRFFNCMAACRPVGPVPGLVKLAGRQASRTDLGSVSGK